MYVACFEVAWNKRHGAGLTTAATRVMQYMGFLACTALNGTLAIDLQNHVRPHMVHIPCALVISRRWRTPTIPTTHHGELQRKPNARIIELHTATTHQYNHNMRPSCLSYLQWDAGADPEPHPTKHKKNPLQGHSQWHERVLTIIRGNDSNYAKSSNQWWGSITCTTTSVVNKATQS